MEFEKVPLRVKNFKQKTVDDQSTVGAKKMKIIFSRKKIIIK